MKNYKIESWSRESVKTICAVIESGGGNCVDMGLAIVTDHCFTSEESDKCKGLISRMFDYEALTDFDLNQFNES